MPCIPLVGEMFTMPACGQGRDQQNETKSRGNPDIFGGFEHFASAVRKRNRIVRAVDTVCIRRKQRFKKPDRH